MHGLWKSHEDRLYLCVKTETLQVEFNSKTKVLYNGSGGLHEIFAVELMEHLALCAAFSARTAWTVGSVDRGWFLTDHLFKDF